MNLTYFGHSCFLLETPAVRLVLDPYLRENPHGSVDPATVPCDFVLCSHAHDDHIADALNLSRLHGATLVAPYELANYFSQQGAKVLDLMPGGGVTLPWGRLQMTPAVHSSALELPNGETRAMGVAAGYVIRAENRSLYHAGDTALFSDMQLIARGGLDLALLPIGDFYTMGPDDAVEAVKLLRPRLTVPMHYNSNERIKTDPHVFAGTAQQAGYTVRVMIAGETTAI
jgi:L-ascorbate metabolism protein UlaG (beta-lactamase superfamily)